MPQLEICGEGIKVVVRDDFGITVFARDGRSLWDSCRSRIPAAVVRRDAGAPLAVPLATARNVSFAPFGEGAYRGRVVRLAGLTGADAVLDLAFAVEPNRDEVMVQVEQVGGTDTVADVEHFYRFEKPVADGGFMLLPRGSGYLVPAECQDALPGEGHRNWEGEHSSFIGACWTLPLFGMTKGNGDAWCAIIESWWDCEVKEEHIPGQASALDFNWRSSLGKLNYARRFLLRFDHGMDHVSMAKLYRAYAAKQGLVRTLEEKAAQTPALRQYLEGILFRWPAWKADDEAAVLEGIRRLQNMGMKVNFFFPKWSSAGYAADQDADTSADCNWQASLHPNPVPGGWPVLVKLAEKVRGMGCVIQGFTNMLSQNADGVEYDEARWPVDANGQRCRNLSTHDAPARLTRMLNHLRDMGLKQDVLYFDSYAAHGAPPEDFSPAHPVTRRQAFETENACFAETRRRGIMPGAELARFWCIGDCDYFFFTDWSSDRLTNVFTQGAPAPVGEPVPLFELVFHECYMAGFSGGGYAVYAPGFDWWGDRTPRLYEMLFASAPAYNWLPEGTVPVYDWQEEKTRRRCAWLKRWSAYYRAVATSEMLSHRFLSRDRRQQRTEFANGVAASFDMAGNRFCVAGVNGFTGQWETPEELYS